MKKHLFLVIALGVTALWAGNSIFSYQGFPVQNYGKDIYSIGMGDTGASDIFRINTGYANPAMNERTNRTLFGTGMIMGYTNYQSESSGIKESFRDDALDFPYFNVSVPIGKHRFSAQFNSHSSGVVSNQKKLADGSTEFQSTDKYLYRADLIYGTYFKNLQAGISGNFYFGHDNQSFSQTSDSYAFDTSEHLSRDFKNVGLTLGVLQRLKNMSFGAHVSLPVTLKGESVYANTHITEAKTDYEYELPGQFNLSSTVMATNNFKIAADVSYETWASISPQYRDTKKIGVGFAYEPDKDKQKTSFGNLPLRAGAYYRELAFKDKYGSAIDEMAVSCGLTLPLKSKVSRIDLGLQYLQRGDLGTNRLSDTSLMFMLGFTGFDLINKAKDNTAPRDIPIKEEFE
ncbi:MAG: hypothetical protein CVU50_00235 [Candidatus Cloacimonetes bacterium HGW-Cloacimonetes-3]|jgi:hypothetical protein|nr:MAG: hypothetical protein CVU50_00235 [Candidatus Cloacimonetes bacterium HGW-Cloacimonetes-3]